MKKTLRLTESDLHRIVKESVIRVLKEMDWKVPDPENNEEDYYESERREQEALKNAGDYAQKIHPQTDSRRFAHEFSDNKWPRGVPNHNSMTMFHNYHRQNKYY